MPEKLLTLQELSSYLGISEDKIVSLVEEGAISAYKVGGEFLRFRKDQIDAICAEISSRTSESDRIPQEVSRQSVNVRHETGAMIEKASFADNVSDFFHFYDFYIVSAFLIVVLVAAIFYL